MAKKSVEGQTDLFELFGSVEELEENVKGVPELPEEEPEAVVVAELKSESVEEKLPIKKKTTVKTAKLANEQAVMQKTFYNKATGQTAVIAYLNYNKVYQKIWEEEPIIYQFEQSKDAVDYYVKQMEQMTENKQIEVLKEQESLMEAPLIPWTKG